MAKRVEPTGFVTTRWDLIASAERDELREATDHQKLRQVAALMASARAMGWSRALRDGDEEVWEMWQRLRRAVGVVR